MQDKRNIINFQADDDLMKRLDDFRFENRFKTLSEAIRLLLDDALKRYEKKLKNQS